MKKIAKKINFPAELWQYIKENSQNSHKSMNQYLTDLVVADMRGTQPVSRNGKAYTKKYEPTDPIPQLPSNEPAEAPLPDYGVDMKRIRSLQDDIHGAELRLEQVIGGLNAEDIERAKEENDYVRENFELIAKAEAELDQLVPKYKED